MSAGLFYDRNVIARIEQGVRVEFAKFAQQPGNGGPQEQCYARIGKVVGPAIAKASISEQNLNTPASVVTNALNQMMVWAILRRIDGSGATKEQMIAHVVTCCNQIGDSAIASIEKGLVKIGPQSKPNGEAPNEIKGEG